ncbi:MAG: hypothetical protein PHQ90_08855 [Sulfuricurvum sp.]|uniref:hypothetical protein n=1 Tax=Sulfuricurvum sp. TaxID=2025608 RepID=UPI002614E087|nr:hypothetical protein [Sulfuricurvum sp.]MDD2369398.1 hypothetical protein [Sulfuricurvum sp.]MDD2949284.1 hypothetical protein [Sulfuricurvum sp.]MDD5119312.1 hypothetical protein [Sulfuricurvum sp.]
MLFKKIIMILIISFASQVFASDVLNIKGIELSKSDINKQIKNGFIISNYKFKNYLITNKQIYKSNALETQYDIKKDQNEIGKIISDKLATDHYKARVYNLSDTLYFIFEQEAEYSMSYIVFEISKNTATKIIDNSYSCDKYMPPKLKDTADCYPADFIIYSEKDGGLYMKVGSTYKSDIITLKKPANVK